MVLLDFPIELRSARERIHIHNFTDIHLAAFGCDRKRLQRDIRDIALRNLHSKNKERHLWFGGGDWANAIGPKDWRHDPAAIAPEFREHVGSHLFDAEANALHQLFLPIREWGIGIGMGNHEEKIARECETNPAMNCARTLKLPYLGYSAAIRYRLKEPNGHTETIIHYWHHGRGASRTKGGKVNMIWAMRDIVSNADVYTVGHVHEMLDFPDVRMEVTRARAMRLDVRPTIFQIGGTYQRAYAVVGGPLKPFEFREDAVAKPDYAEKFGMRPSVIGHNGFSMQMQHTNGKTAKKRGEAQWSVSLRREDYRA